MNILGISARYHDSACCLLRDGTLVAAAQEERFSRVKQDRSLPRQAFRYCLREANLTIADVDCIAFYEDPQLKLGRQIWSAQFPGLSAKRRADMLRVLADPTPQDWISRVFGFDGPIEVVDHHLSHAASSYYFSGFDEAAILTVDGVGDWPTTTYGRGAGAVIERLETVDFPDSLGLFYSAITAYLGFEVNEGEYKVMGLAPYGEPIYADRLAKLVQSSPGGQYRLDLQYFGFLDQEQMYSDAFVSLMGRPARLPETPLERFHLDVARSAQAVLEDVLLQKVRYLGDMVPSENLCMAGGVALNVVANARCRNEGPFKRLFIQPAAGDAGGAVGAAAMAYVRRSGEWPTRKLRDVFLGPRTETDAVADLLTGSGVPFLDFRGREDDLLREVVRHLADGKVVGWFQGRAEFGPRALGGRSIIADPRPADMRDRINASVKKRESFRPFAPSVLAEECAVHFDLPHPSPFMLETCQVVSPIDLPAITHVDGSARVHTVDDAENPRFAALLRHFQEHTGCPLLLNTSFNMRGEPIVNSAVDAIVSFVESSIDVLVLEDAVVDRAVVTPLWELMASRHYAAVRERKGHVGHLVYTLF